MTSASWPLSSSPCWGFAKILSRARLLQTAFCGPSLLQVRPECQTGLKIHCYWNQAPSLFICAFSNWPTDLQRQPIMRHQSSLLDHKESWAPKNWRFWTVVLEKTLENPLDFEEIKPVNPKENQPWILFIGRIDAKTEAPILWPPDAESPLIGKDPAAGKDWRQEEKRMTED